MTAQESLLPCPFCGGDAVASEINPKAAPGWFHLTVTHTPECFYKPSQEVLLLNAVELERWNRRAALPAEPVPTVGFDLWWVDHMPSATQAKARAEWVKLHAQPVARTPLSDEQIDALWGGAEAISVPQRVNRRAIARSIEAAHGITQEKQG